MKKVLFVALLFCFAFSGPAYALNWVDVSPENASDFTPVWFQFDSNGDNAVNSLDNNTVFISSWGTYLTYGYAGQFALNLYDTLQGNQGPHLLFGAYGYCVDLLNPSGDGVAERRTLSSGVERQIAWLMDYALHTHDNTIDDQVALQLAIWNTLYGDRFTVLDGLNPDPIYKAYIDYITALGANEYTGNDFKYLDFEGDLQDMIFYVVPEPKSAILVGLGFILLAGFGARKKIRLF